MCGRVLERTSDCRMKSNGCFPLLGELTQVLLADTVEMTHTNNEGHEGKEHQLSLVLVFQSFELPCEHDAID